MGVVYKAEDTKLKRTVALKFLLPALTKDPQAKARFVQEAQAAAALDHPNICAVFEISEADGATYIVMPCVKGQSLKEKIAAGPLSVEEALDIAGQVAEGLKEAHERGIIHRDIKPANIMLTEKGQAKIMDFGLAKLTAAADVTQTLGIMGTIAYMSPEQARGEAVDHRTDIWSFGAMVYEILTGRMPFRPKHEQTIVFSILNDSPEPPSRLCNDIPRPIEQLILKALEKDKIRRYQNMAELLKDLKAARLSGVKMPKVEKSIIVLPFENISPDPEQEYFCDGMTEEIITDLSHVHDLLVISRSSAMTFKGTKKTIPEIAGAVNVRYVLEGSVRKAGNNLRITAQLIDSSTDAHLWAEKYNGTLDDIFDIQEKVSRSIVNALALKLSSEENRRLGEREIKTVQAYEAYLRARQEIYRWTEPALERARLHLENALAIVGENALLFAGLGNVYATYAHAGFRMDEATLSKAEEYATKALKLEPGLAQGHSLLGSIAMVKGQMKEGFRQCQRALLINPNDPDTLFFTVATSGHLGKTSYTEPLAARFLKIDPLSPVAYLTSGLVHWLEGRFNSALESYRESFRLDPESIISRWWFVAALAANRLFQEAEAVLDKWLGEMPGHVMVMSVVFFVNALRNEKAKALSCISENWTSSAWKDYWLPLIVAEGYSLIGETAEALRWFEQAVDKGWINFPFLSQIDPWLANLRGEPRFKKLIERVKKEWEEFEV